MGEEGLLAVNLVTLLVVHDEHLSLLQLRGQCGVSCGGAQRGEKFSSFHSALASSQGPAASIFETQPSHTPSCPPALLHQSVPLRVGETTSGKSLTLSGSLSGSLSLGSFGFQTKQATSQVSMQPLMN